MLIFLFLFLFSCSSNELTVENFNPDKPFSDVPWDTCGIEVGDYACDFVLQDQDDTSWRLYSFYQKKQLIVLDVSAMWCPPCQEAARYAQVYQDNYPEIQWLTVLLQNLDRETPTQTDLALWSETFSLNEPVLASSSYFNYWYPIHAIPTFLLIDENMIIQQVVIGFEPIFFALFIEANLE